MDCKNKSSAECGKNRDKNYELNRTEKILEIRSELKRKSIELKDAARRTSIEANKTAGKSADAAADEVSKKKRKVSKKKHRRGKNKSNKKPTNDKHKNSAPFNTTQFIMNDHGDTIQYLDNKLGVGKNDNSENNPSASDVPKKRISRARESSFSLDSDEDFYYSSPEDEEDFVNKEFLKDYNNIRSDRLVALSKGELINEYLQIEARVEMLEKRIAKSKRKRQAKNGNQAEMSGANFDVDKCGIPMEPEVVEKIKSFQQEIRALCQDNRKLRKENLLLKREMELDASKRRSLEELNEVDNSDSGSTCSTCSSSCSSCSNSDEEEMSQNENTADKEAENEEPSEMPNGPVNLDENAQDTGYNISQSNGIKIATENTVTSTSK